MIYPSYLFTSSYFHFALANTKQSSYVFLFQSIMYVVVRFRLVLLTDGDRLLLFPLSLFIFPLRTVVLSVLSPYDTIINLYLLKLNSKSHLLDQFCSIYKCSWRHVQACEGYISMHVCFPNTSACLLTIVHVDPGQRTPGEVIDGEGPSYTVTMVKCTRGNYRDACCIKET